MKTPASIENN